MSAWKRRIIPSEKLRTSDLPPPEAIWRQLVRFAATFDSDAETLSVPAAPGVEWVHRAAQIPDLRIALFHEYRRYNHFGYDPDPAVLIKARQVVDRIRGQLEAREAENRSGVGKAPR